jgi:hypothetical protein
MTTVVPDAVRGFSLPPPVQAYVELKEAQRQLRLKEVALKPHVESWISTLPKQSIELDQGVKLKMTTVTRRVVTLANLTQGIEATLIESGAMKPGASATAFAERCAASVWDAREVKQSRVLQRTVARAPAGGAGVLATLVPR